MSIISNTSLITKGHGGKCMWQNKYHSHQIKTILNWKSLDVNWNKLKLEHVKSHPISAFKPFLERGPNNRFAAVLIFLSGRTSEGQRCLQESLTNLKRNSSLARLSPSISRCEPFWQPYKIYFIWDTGDLHPPPEVTAVYNRCTFCSR